MANNNAPKIPDSQLVRFFALFFVCAVLAPLLLAQAPASDVQTAAAAVSAQAQFALTHSYFQARYVTLNYVDMLVWYQKSAAQGYAPAQNQLGSMYENNIGLPQNFKRAANYYQLAAKQGFALAQYN